MMPRKPFHITFVTLTLLGVVLATTARAEASFVEPTPPPQSPVQVIVQIVVTAAALKVLERFNLP